MSGCAKMLGFTPSAEDGETSFVPISLGSLRSDTITSFDIYIRPLENRPHVLYCEKNLRFDESSRQRLLASRVTQIFIKCSQRAQYRQYIEANLEAILSDASIPQDDKTEVLYVTAAGVVEDLLVKDPSPDKVKRGKEIVRHTVDAMVSDKQMLQSVLRIISTNYAIYTHSINVVAYSVALAQRAGYTDPGTLREIATGALLHDIGKSKIPADVLSAQRPLTNKEMELVRQHPVMGHEILQGFGNVGEIALDIVLHHHERLRGGGYPDNIQGDWLSPFVRIVTIADVFDALTTERPFQRARNSFVAFKTIRNEMGHDIDPDLFRIFVGLLGIPNS